MLRFTDGTKVTVIGLNEILAELYSEDRPANQETAEEIIKRLEAVKNYIPSSDVTRREFRGLLQNEYREYLEGRDKKSAK